MTTEKAKPVADDFDGIGWREYMRGIENGNISPTDVRLRAVCRLARENLEALAEQSIAAPARRCDAAERESLGPVANINVLPWRRLCLAAMLHVQKHWPPPSPRQSQSRGMRNDSD